MGIKTTKYLQSRKFINASQGLGAMECQVETTHYSTDDQVIDASISIQDCNRSIHLEFGVYEKKDIPAKLNKINLMIAELNKFKDAFEKAAGKFHQKPAAKKKSKPIVIPK
jgi:hypothetical protein